MTAFIRLVHVDASEKGRRLAHIVDRWRSGIETEDTFHVNTASFAQVPGAPLAYWVSERIRALFSTLPPLEGDGRTVKQGLATADDFRFVRLWWEVDAESIGVRWFTFAKGGAAAPFRGRLATVVDWKDDGRCLKVWAGRTGDHWSRRIVNPQLYFRPGLTFPRRATAFRTAPMPAGCIFSNGAQVIFLSDQRELWAALMLSNSRPVNVLLGLMAGGASSPQFEVGAVGRLPWPSNAGGSHASDLLSSVASSRGNSHDPTAHAFSLPAVLQVSGTSLSERCNAWSDLLHERAIALDRIRTAIDEIAYNLYGIAGDDRRAMEESVVSQGADELGEEVDDEAEEAVDESDKLALTEAFLEWALGTAFGMFDVRLATGDRAPAPHPDPFDPLPVHSPGMLQHDAASGGYVMVGYPLDLPPHAVLVDDPGHPWDVVARIESVLEVVADKRGHEWIREAEGVLGTDRRTWLRRNGFERHLKRYSISRRQAPLFWHLALKSRAYSIWLYSPLATRDTFYRIQNDYVEPKLKAAERRLLELRQHAGASPTGQQRRDLTSQESLVEELRAFREQVALIAPLWKPFRDDGVVLNCAVLSGLFDHHRAWQKECAKKWSELAAGKYDWAGWAMHLWPERVVKACASDRSIAIAHGLEEALWKEDEDGKWAPRRDVGEQIAKLLAERRSPAIEAALDAFGRAG